MRDRLEAFLTDLDQALAPQAEGETFHVYHIGRSALVWEYDYSATTHDFDILRPRGAERLVDLALQWFGRNTRKAKEHDLYLEVVDPALPPMPAGYENRAR